MKCKECNSEQIYAKQLCSACYGKHSMRKYRELHPEEDKKRKREWYQEHKQEFCEVRRKSRFLRVYNLTLEQLEEMKANQQYRCLICREEYELKVDHNHKTGKIRGLLCDLCNRGLGYFRDNPLLLQEAINYLEKEK